MLRRRGHNRRLPSPSPQEQSHLGCPAGGLISTVVGLNLRRRFRRDYACALLGVAGAEDLSKTLNCNLVSTNLWRKD